LVARATSPRRKARPLTVRSRLRFSFPSFFYFPLRRPHRSQGVFHPHLLPVYDVRTNKRSARPRRGRAGAAQGGRLEAGLLGEVFRPGRRYSGPDSSNPRSRLLPGRALEGRRRRRAFPAPITPPKSRVAEAAEHAFSPGDPLDGPQPRPALSRLRIVPRPPRPAASPTCSRRYGQAATKRRPPAAVRVPPRRARRAYFSVAHITRTVPPAAGC